MKRRILFRGQKVDTKEWVYGSFVLDSEGHPRIAIVNKSGEGLRFDKVIPESAGQFTGLTDKNSVKVFSDDLLKDGKEDVFRVYQIAGGFCVKSSVWKTDTKEWDYTDILIAASLTDAQTQSYISESCEVIGNIHDKHFENVWCYEK
jgi:uncharacterized phage protein (TIGR01671 family)